MTTLTAYANIKDGKLILANKKRFAQDLGSFKDCAVELTIRKKNRRSSPQNRYLWGVVYKEVEIRLKQLGNDVNADVVHEFLKGKFLQVPMIGEGGEVIENLPGSTADLNKEEFALYVDKIIEWAAQFLEITIPSPGEVLTLDLV